MATPFCTNALSSRHAGSPCMALTQLRMVSRSFPPGRRFGFGTAGKSYLHMYQAHIAAYDAIKASDGA